jgi:hypothetical protein
LQEEEEAMKNLPLDQVINPKTPNISKTYSMLPSEEPLIPLMGLEGLRDLEDQEGHQPYPLDTLSLFNQLGTSNKQE